jgi:hypothetical protein
LSAITHSDINTSPRLRITRALTLGVLLVTAFASTAWAQVPNREVAAAAPAPTTTRALYQGYLAADCIPGSNFCKFVSENVPARGLLEIQRVACQGWHQTLELPSFVVIAELRTSADVFVGRIDFLKATYTTASWGSVWAISEQTQMFVPANHKLRISLNTGTIGVGSYGCTISGYLTTS